MFEYNRVQSNVLRVVSKQTASCEAMTLRVASKNVCKLQAKEPMSCKLAVCYHKWLCY